MKILALITARANSKRIPRKNWIEICGIPLYKYTTELELLGLVEDVTFSSDVVNEFELFSNIHKIHRPAELAQDDTPHMPVIKHGLEMTEDQFKKQYDYVLLLQPTNPTRTIEDVKLGINTLPADLIRSYYWDKNLDWNYILGINTFAVTTEYPKIHSGAVWIFSRQYIQDWPAVSIYHKRKWIEVKKSHGYNLNIEEDIPIIEAFLKEKEK